MKLIFPYEEKTSDIFAHIKRPVAKIHFWSKLTNGWLEYPMIVDTGADYTLLPYCAGLDLGVNFNNDCLSKRAYGVGGQVKVFFLKRKAKIRIGDLLMEIPLGFINSNKVPPLLGREGCLNKLQVLLANYRTELSD